MKMKPLFGLIAGVAIILSSCATSNEVNGGGIFQKRKYNKGFYWNRGGSASETTSKIDHQEFEATTFVELSENRTLIGDENRSEIYVAENQNQNSSVEAASINEPKETKGKLSYTSSLKENPLTQIVHPIKKMAEAQSKLIQKTAAKAKAPGREGDLGYILGLVLIIVLIILILTLLSQLLSDIASYLGPLLALILLIVLIILLLRWLGVM